MLYTFHFTWNADFVTGSFLIRHFTCVRITAQQIFRCLCCYHHITFKKCSFWVDLNINDGFERGLFPSGWVISGITCDYWALDTKQCPLNEAVCTHINPHTLFLSLPLCLARTLSPSLSEHRAAGNVIGSHVAAVRAAWFNVFSPGWVAL